jgi:hypothetical protein
MERKPFEIDLTNPHYLQFKDAHALFMTLPPDTKGDGILMMDPYCVVHLLPDIVRGVLLDEDQKIKLICGKAIELNSSEGLLFRPDLGRLYHRSGDTYEYSQVYLDEVQFTGANKHLMAINTFGPEFKEYREKQKNAETNMLAEKPNPMKLIYLLPDKILNETLNSFDKFSLLKHGVALLPDARCLLLVPESGQMYVSHEPVSNPRDINSDSFRPLLRSECKYDFELKPAMKQQELTKQKIYGNGQGFSLS